MTAEQYGSGLVGAVIGYFSGNALIGFAIGLVIGGMLFPPEAEILQNQGPSGVKVQTAKYGSVIPILYGKRKVAGNIIWHDMVLNRNSTVYSTDGTFVSNNPSGLANFAIALCYSTTAVTLVEAKQGADIITTGFTFYDGTQITPDPTIGSQDRDTAPIWKNLVYVVFNDVDISDSGVMPLYTFVISNNDDGWLAGDVVLDMMTNPYYGGDIDTALISTQSLAITNAYCTAENIKLHALLNKQADILQNMQFIAEQCNCTIFSNERTINLLPLVYTDTVRTYDSTNIVHKNGVPQVTIHGRKYKEHVNKISAIYTRADDDYVVGTAVVDNYVDQEEYGLIEAKIGMSSLTNLNTVNKVLTTKLKMVTGDYRTIEMVLDFTEIDYILLTDLVEIDYPEIGLNNFVGRLYRINVKADRTIEVALTEEYASNYNYTSSDVTVNPIDGSKLPVILAPNDVINTAAIQVPYSIMKIPDAVVYFFEPTNADIESYKGSYLYTDTSSWLEETKVTSNLLPSGTYGVVSTVGNDYIEVTFENEKIFSSIDTIEEFLLTNVQNIAMTDNSLYFRFMTATIVSLYVWRFDFILSDLDGVPILNSTGSIAVSDGVYFIKKPAYLNFRVYDFSSTEFKAVAVNKLGESQDITTVTAFSLFNESLDYTPMSPTNIAVNGVGLVDGDTHLLTDMLISWVGRSRAGSDNNPARSDSTTHTGAFLDYEVNIYTLADVLVRTELLGTTREYLYTSADITTDGVTTGFKVEVVENTTTLSSVNNEVLTLNIV